MSIENLTIGECREIAKLFSNGAAGKPSPHPLMGKNVIVRTVTMIYTGRVVGNDEFGLHLSYAAWIPETDRWMQFVADGKVKECEPYPDDLIVYLNSGSFLEVLELRKPLFRVQK